jgi:hypothetical protein
MGAAAKRSPAPESIAPVPTLVSTQGQPVREYRILGERALIGSGDGADFVLNEPTVSRRHALISKRGAIYLLSDLGSSNGTFVNGRRLAPSTESALSNADDIQIGVLHFTFAHPESAERLSHRNSLTRLIAVLVVLFVVLAIVVSYFLHHSFWNRFQVRPTPPAAVVSDTWLSSLNRYRQSAGLTPVSEVGALSGGDANHARYLVANKAEMIRSGTIDASIHEENPAQRYFTPEGKTAGALSDVDTVFTDPPEIPDPPWAIENWFTGPFHRMWLLNPALHQVGYGQFCENGICAAALNIRSGVSATPGAAPQVIYPPDRATIRNGTFSADEVEWPDPLATCDYHTPTGLPITLQIGGIGPARLEEFSLARNGTAVESCAFDASSYRNTDPVAVERVKHQLAHFAAIVMVPKEPLVHGATYQVKITASGQTFSWQFAVAP